MHIKFEIFGKDFGFKIHGKKENIFKKCHYHWSGRLQNYLWLRGFSVHNFVIDECTQDFSCCSVKNDPLAGVYEQLAAMASDVDNNDKDYGIMFINKEKNIK
jgi:hypothetical protein